MAGSGTPPAAGCLVEVQGLSRRFGRRWALARVSFRVRPGGVLMLTGPNGSGKSTLLACLATALRPHEGSIRVDGRDAWAHRDALRRTTGFLAHQGRVYEDLSARDNLAVWARLGGHEVDLDGLLARVSLPAARRDPVRAFSAGMRRRLALAIALLKKPRLALLDEPFESIDPAGRALMGEVMRDLRGAGTTVVLSTHLPAESAPFSDEALHLEEGRVTWAGPASEAAGRTP